MNALVALLLLGQIIGCTFSHDLPTQIDCNGEEAKKLAKLAVDDINEHIKHGYKHVLNTIEDVRVVDGGSGTKLTYLKLSLLETVCHTLDTTPIKKCTVRPQHYHAVEAHCDVQIHSCPIGDSMVAVKCHSHPDSVENVRRNCPKCPILLPLNDPQVVESVEYVLQKHNKQLPDHAYELLEISRGQHKYEPEAYYLEFAIVETNCSTKEAHDNHHDCHPKSANESHTGFCRATVYRSHAATEKPKHEKSESDCIIFDRKEGFAQFHLIEQHYAKNIISPGHSNTVLDLAHSHNRTSASYGAHSQEEEVTVASPVVKGKLQQRHHMITHMLHPFVPEKYITSRFKPAVTQSREKPPS